MERFNENVELMCARRGIRKKELIAFLGISKAAFYAKLAGVRPWLLDEAHTIAEYLGTTIDSLIS